MINEHAMMTNQNLTIDDLNFLIKKANRLGLSHREVARVYQEKEGEKVHIYFEAEEWKTIPHYQRRTR